MIGGLQSSGLLACSNIVAVELVVTLRDCIRLIKEAPVLNFDRSLYICKRLFAPAPDKTLIPMSIVYRKDLYDATTNAANGDKPPESNPLHLYGYGTFIPVATLTP